MEIVSLRDLYEIVKYLTEKDLFGLYESAFNVVKKEFPIIDRKEAQLSQINEKMREIISNIEKYKNIESLKNEVFDMYYGEMKGEIPEKALKQFLDSLFEDMKQKIRSHPKIKDKLMILYTEDIFQYAR